LGFEKAITGEGELIIMRAIKYYLLMFAVFFLCGCMSFKSQIVGNVNLTGANALEVRSDYALNIFKKTNLINSVIFEYKFFKLAVLNYLKIDTSNLAVESSYITPTGFKLLEVVSRDGCMVSSYAAQQLLQRGDMVKWILTDIYKMYFDLVPFLDAKVIHSTYSITFSQPFESGRLDYIFGNQGVRLIEKQYFEHNKCVWRIKYSNYADRGGYLCPSNITLINYRYGYQVKVKVKDML
jgi:hypothetical protein